MRIHVLPLFLGFSLLGALSHEAVNQINGVAPSRAGVAPPAPLHQAGAPRQLRALGLNGSRDGAIAPLPAFVIEPDRGSTDAWAI